MSTTPKPILVIGPTYLDLAMNVFRLPGAGEATVDDGGFGYIPGGGGTTLALAFARLGAAPALCSKLGRDLHGQKLYRFLEENGVDTSAVRVDPDLPTGFRLVIKETGLLPRTVSYPGANGTLSLEHLADALSHPCCGVYLTLENGFSTALGAAKIAASKGLPLFLDAAPAKKDFPLESLPPVEILMVDEEEAALYTGIEPIGVEDCIRTALALFRRVRCRHLVIKMGARGAFLYDGSHHDVISAFRVERVVDTAGAGHAFGAAAVFSYLYDGDIVKAVRYATAAGALTVSRKGEALSVPTAAEIVSLFQSHT